MKNFVSFMVVASLAFALFTPKNLLADDDGVVEAEIQTDLLVEELLSAVTTITEQVTPETAEELSQAVTDFLATQDSYRLIGYEEPLGADSGPVDRFERRALRRALRRGRMTQRVVRGELRTVIPLTFSQSDATANCATCHGNYNDLVDGPNDIVVVGAATFRVPLED